MVTSVPMTGDFMRRMDKIYAPKLGWQNATLHSRRRGFATAAVRTTVERRHAHAVCSYEGWVARPWWLYCIT